MTVITVPVNREQESFIKSLIKSGRAANKAHAMRLAIQALAREEEDASLARALQEIKEGKTLKGDLYELAKLVD
jgi:Arc/MetJ-type ribon-helix-helix transcriptional regulator